MSKKENHWYIVGNTIELMTKGLRPRAWQLVLWVLLVALFLVAFQTGALDAWLRNVSSPAFAPVFGVLLTALMLAGIFGVAVWRRATVRAEYVKALQQSDPGKLIDVVARSLRGARALPDADAFSAQSRALAYALYGRGDEATRVLAEVSWRARAPIIQGVGMSAEGIVELLCQRAPQRALELNRRARGLALLGRGVPGATQSERYHGVCVAVSEALLNIESSASVRWLEEGAADARYPPLQLLASFGLAVVAERSGGAERAQELRTQIRALAPYCAPLQLSPAEFSTSGQEGVASPSSASSSLASPAVSSDVAAGVEQRSAMKTLKRSAGITLGLWALLILAFAAIWLFLNQK